MFAWPRTLQRPLDHSRKDPKGRIANALGRHRPEIVALLQGGVLPNRLGETEERFRARLDDGLELFIRALEGREGDAALWAGQHVIDLYDPDLSREANTARTRESLATERACLGQTLRPHLSTREVTTFEEAFDQLTRGLGRDATKHARTLFVGDRMMAEIASFLISKRLADGVSMDLFPINSRDPATLKRIIEGLAPSFEAPSATLDCRNSRPSSIRVMCSTKRRHASPRSSRFSRRGCSTSSRIAMSARSPSS